MADAPSSAGPLAGLLVLDLSRVLAGPWCSQLLGDLGAEVIKVEQPGAGDDTRRWGPPFLPDGSGDSAYYCAANRNKRSIAVNMAAPEGAALLRRLAERADVVLENFRVGGLAKYGLDYASLAAIKPDLIYCSITGFGQYGPYAHKGGYDFLIQGMSGLMSVTGLPDDAPGGGPMKVGVPTVDLSTGLYAAVSILAALRHRDRTGEGQHIDCALLDTQVALMTNQASNWLNGGMVPQRMGNAHPNLLPYQDFRCADGVVLVALGNDRQFRDFCVLLDVPELADDPRYVTNAARSAHRGALITALEAQTLGWDADALIAAMDAAKLPGGKVNSVPEIMADPHIAARGLIHSLDRADGTPVRFPGYPSQLSATPATYRHPPPLSGQDTAAVLRDLLGMDDDAISGLAASGVIGGD